MNPPASNTRPVILVVDDDLITRKYFKACLERAGWEVVLADSGSVAMDAIRGRGPAGFACVVSDYRMPGLTGLDLCRWLREQDPTLAAIIATSEGEKKVLADSLREGVSDFLDKPVTAALLASAAAKAGEETRRRRASVHALSSAKAIGQLQSKLMELECQRSSRGLDICHHPCHEAGGDFVSIFPLGPEKTLVLAGDVSGHDLKAAFVSAYFQGMARGMLERSAPVGEILAHFNRFLLNEWHPSRGAGWGSAEVVTSLAVCAASIDYSTGEVRLHTAGFCNPVFVDTEGMTSLCAGSGGCPLGWFEDGDLSEISLVSPAGGCLFLWSDGLEDFAEANGVSPGAVAWRLLQENSHAARGAILHAANDDVTLIRIPLRGPRDNTPILHPILHADYRGDQAGDIELLQDQWRRSLEFALPNLPESRCYDALLCAREALLNAMKHGCGGRADTCCNFQIALRADASALRIRLSDPGPGHDDDFLDNPHREIEGCGRHLGFVLLKQLPDRIHVARRGADLALDFDLTLPHAHAA